MSNRTRVFYGRVVDKDGQGIEAEVVIHQSRVVKNAWSWGSVLPDKRPENKGSVFSGGKNGVFLVMLPYDCNYLQILDIKANGYEWVFDWAWQVEENIFATNNNMVFCLSGPNIIPPEYFPDPKNPAVFPVYKIGDAQPSTRPSRGGSDRLRDGTVRINGPVDVQIPSAGPGAPKTSEVEAAIRAYVDRTNAATKAQHQRR